MQPHEEWTAYLATLARDTRGHFLLAGGVLFLADDW
jgi:hypothetical protein